MYVYIYIYIYIYIHTYILHKYAYISCYTHELLTTSNKKKTNRHIAHSPNTREHSPARILTPFLPQMSSWLDEEGFDAKTEQLQKKYAELKEVGDPIFYRSMELHRRPEAVQKALAYVENSLKLLVNLTKEHPWLNESHTQVRVIDVFIQLFKWWFPLGCLKNIQLFKWCFPLVCLTM
jgi:hypothetical protein